MLFTVTVSDATSYATYYAEAYIIQKEHVRVTRI